jgi:hypothetical protein
MSMSITTTAPKLKHLLLAGAALCASAATADARPRRLVVKEVDGQRSLADAADAALRKALAEYDLVSERSWTEAQVAARKTTAGRSAWAIASRTTGAGAVVDGFVRREGRHDVLVVTIFEAADGRELDPLTVRIGPDGMTPAQIRELREGLDRRLQWINPGDEAFAPPSPIPEVEIQKKERPRKPTLEETLGKKPTEAKPKETGSIPGCYDIHADCSVPEDLANPGKPSVPELTKRFAFWGGFYVDSRSLTWDAGGSDLDEYSGVSGRGLALSGELFPWPLAKYDGRPSGVGFSASVYKSAGAVVGIDGDDIGDYTIDQSGFTGAVHWRQPVGVWTIDGEVGYSRHGYAIEDAPMGWEVPDVAYSSAHAGAHVDLAIGKRASVGFGGRYFYTFSAGNLNDENTYGAGVTTGLSLDANFKIPLPHNMFVRGKLEWRRFSTEFDGSGEIADMELVRSGTDSTVGLIVGVGVEL